MIYYLPLEREPMRYTASLDEHIVGHLAKTGKLFRTRRIYPTLPEIFNRPLPQGMFLDAPPVRSMVNPGRLLAIPRAKRPSSIESALYASQSR